VTYLSRTCEDKPAAPLRKRLVLVRMAYKAGRLA
jgi:hypothetical protein